MQIFHGRLLIADMRMCMVRGGFFQHLAGNIHAKYGSGAVLSCIDTMPTIAAAQIEYTSACEIRQETLQCRPFSGTGKS